MRQGRKCVLFVSPVPPPVHGAALAMQYLLEQMQQTNVIVLHVDAKFAEGLGDLGRFSLKKIFRLAGYAWQMLRHVMRGGVDLIVLTPTFHFKPFLKDAILIWWSTMFLRRRTAAWLHMDYRAMGYENLSRPARWFVRTTLRRCDRFVICAEGLRRFMPAWMPAGKIDAVSNGIPAFVPPRARAVDGWIRVLYLSNLEEAKGWRILLEAARGLCRDLRDVEFVFHGRPAFGLTDGDVRREIDADDAGGRIRYGGPVYDAAKWQALADADIFAFPSFHESFPLSVLEALAAGLPVVATGVGGVADALTDGEGGLLVPPGNCAAMQSALRTLLNDADLRARMGAWNRRRYESDYTVTAYGQRWLAWIHRNADPQT